jgi:hypothetical protein
MTSQRLARWRISQPDLLARSVSAHCTDPRGAADASIGARRNVALKAPIPLLW